MKRILVQVVLLIMVMMTWGCTSSEILNLLASIRLGGGSGSSGGCSSCCW